MTLSLLQGERPVIANESFETLPAIPLKSFCWGASCTLAGLNHDYLCDER
jgi:hypothetical protein